MRFGGQRTWIGMVLLASVAAAAQVPAPVTPAWKLVWSDEFNGPNGSAVDATQWVTETGGGWGNNEIEYYNAEWSKEERFFANWSNEEKRLLKI